MLRGMTHTKTVDGIRFRLESPRGMHSLSEDMYVWTSPDGRSMLLTDEEESSLGVPAFRGMLTNPYRG